MLTFLKNSVNQGLSFKPGLSFGFSLLVVSLSFDLMISGGGLSFFLVSLMAPAPLVIPLPDSFLLVSSSELWELEIPLEAAVWFLSEIPVVVQVSVLHFFFF